MNLREKPAPQEQVNHLFGALWPSLESQVNEAKHQSPEPEQPKRSAEDMLDELVGRMRQLERIQPIAMEQLAYYVDRLEHVQRRLESWEPPSAFM